MHLFKDAVMNYVMLILFILFFEVVFCFDFICFMVLYCLCVHKHFLCCFFWVLWCICWSNYKITLVALVWYFKIIEKQAPVSNIKP